MGDYGANIQQEGDVLHTMDASGGTVHETGGYLLMTTFIESAVLDCLMGGNRQDDGSQATERLQWAGNEGEAEEHQARGRFLSMCDGRPITSARIPEYEEAAKGDILQLCKTVVKDVEVSASVTGPKRIDLVANITAADGTVHTVTIQGIDV